MRVQSPTVACRGCGYEIAFVKTRNGKNMPVNAETLTAEERAELGRVGATVAYRHGGHVPHWSTCPKAKEFSSR